MIPPKDIKGFNALFNEYYKRFIHFAMGYVKDQQVAEDFTSEAFTVYWEKINELPLDTNPPAYILTTIKNKCLNYLNHLQIQQRVTTELKDHSEWVLKTKISTLEACDPSFLFSDEIQQIIDETLNKLPKKTRQIFILSRNHGLTYKEIAEKTNLSQKSIEFHISKALQLLRYSLRDFATISILFYLF